MPDNALKPNVPDFIPEPSHIRNAAERISPHIHRTPVLSSESLNNMFDCRMFFKCENFQKAGAFKSRGAINVVLQLSNDELSRGVATHSSGNHAAALARAAAISGTTAYVVMPENAPAVKVAAVKHYGGEITFCKPTLDARQTTLDEIIRENGATFIPPYNHSHIISGQGTAALEFLEDRPDLEIIMAPVGGGGLICGTAIAATSINPKIKVIGAEPEAVNDAWKSFKSGDLHPPTGAETVADGLKTSLGTLNFRIIRDKVSDILTVSEPSIITAMRLIWERMKIIVEPSCAVPLAAVMEHPEYFRGKTTGIILSGGNVDLERLPWN